MKTCTKCGEAFPATAEYFHRKKAHKDGLHYQCKVCVSEYGRQYRTDNQERIAGKMHQWREDNREGIAEYNHQYNIDNREGIAGKKHQYHIDNREKMNEKDRRYYKNNREGIAGKKHQYHIDNRGGIAEKKRQYRINNPEKGCAAASRRRARKQGLPDTFTTQQWQQCLEYFNHCCPVCGNQLCDLFGNVKPHADHWIPLSYEDDDNPGSVANNMICLCSTCNLRKNATLPDVWLERKYGKRKAQQVSECIETYFNGL